MTHFFNDSLCAGNLSSRKPSDHPFELPGTAASFWNDVVSSEKLEWVILSAKNTMAQVKIVFKLWECTRFGVAWTKAKHAKTFGFFFPFETSLQDMKKFTNGPFFKTLASPWFLMGDSVAEARHFFLKFSAQLWTKGFHPKWTGSK